MGCCPECCHCGKMKATVWVFWCFNTFFGCVYSGLALATFNAVSEGTDHLTMESETQKSTYKNSLLASCMLGFLIVLFWMIYSFLVLIWRSFGDPKLAWGIMLGTAIHTAWFMILAGLVLQNRDSDMQALKDAGWWSTNDYRTYQATYVMNYILTATFIISFVILFFGRTYLGTNEESSGPGPSGGSQPHVNLYVDMGSLSTAKQASMSRQNLV